jgi:hypothetical protein
MKNLLLIAFVAVISMSQASAEWKTYYVQEQVGQEYPDQNFFKIDWTNKYFFLDSDSEDETLCPMKNYKESGNKKTFDVYYAPSVSSDKYCSVEFSTAEDGKITLVQSMLGEGGKTMKRTYILTDKKPMKDAINDARRDPKQLIKGGVEKVTNVFKKKKDKE